MNHKPETQYPIFYTIMPDFGEAYGWINYDGTDALGGNDNEGGEHRMSDELQAEFAAWQAEFEESAMDWWDISVLLDWRRFHERGMALTRRLKAEWGDAVRVFYEKPTEDPNQRANERVEILADGRVVDCRPRRLQKALRAWMPRAVVSAGQTGVERAALDWACSRRIPHGGWCPQGRRTSDGPLSVKYQLRETESDDERECFKLNVQDSDATLIFNVGKLHGDSLQILQFAELLGKPNLVVQIDQGAFDEVTGRITGWLIAGMFNTVNVTGPREEKCPGIYARTLEVLESCGATPGEESLAEKVLKICSVEG